MALWRVDVHRETTDYFYVEAETRELAEEDARELMSEVLHMEMGDSDDDCFVSYDSVDQEQLGPHDSIWTGGQDGEWTEANSLKGIE